MYKICFDKGLQEKTEKCAAVSFGGKRKTDGDFSKAFVRYCSEESSGKGRIGFIDNCPGL